jgi:TonB-dependent SusC/RagA subfamily outer membrane receptor
MRAIFLFFFMVCCTAVVTAQTKIITGTIKDETGERVPGATVTGKGTQVATITNSDGSFRIVLPESVTSIIITHSTMQTQEVELAGKTNLEVSLKTATNNLNEVVVIGYGTIKKKDLTGSVASISGKAIADAPVPNIAQAMQGKLPGVSIVSQDGRPNANVAIRVRGGTSISQSNQPFILIDGVPGNINDIPADQVKSIDVLKDASATAIYGSQGANGVILITTKGATAGKTTISYNGYQKWNTPTKYLAALAHTYCR